MHTLLLIGFWMSLGLLVYTYVGYPLLMWALARWRDFFQQREKSNLPDSSNPELSDTDWPTVSLLIPAFNEEKVIRQKIENSLELNYPEDKLEIVVASDGSTDSTNAMVTAYGNNEVRFIHFQQREGKTQTLNKVIPQLNGEIVVVTDASAMLNFSALKALIRHFRNHRVGAVSGIYRFDSQVNQSHEGLRDRGESLYWQYETFLKKQESKVNSVIGAHGALLAFRKDLFTPLPPNAINDDFIIPMQILEKGYRVMYEPKAEATEESHGNTLTDFRRRSRIFVGNLQQIFILHRLLNPLRGMVWLQFLSHKILRTFSPLFLLSILGSNLFLHQGFYLYFLAAQLLFYGIALIGCLLNKWLRLASMPFYFVFGNISAIAGYLKFILRQQPVTWVRS